MPFTRQDSTLCEDCNVAYTQELDSGTENTQRARTGPPSLGSSSFHAGGLLGGKAELRLSVGQKILGKRIGGKSLRADREHEDKRKPIKGIHCHWPQSTAGQDPGYPLRVPRILVTLHLRPVFSFPARPARSRPSRPERRCYGRCSIRACLPARPRGEHCDRSAHGRRARPSRPGE